MRGGRVSNNLYELLLFSQVTCYAKPIPSSLMFFLCFSDPYFSFSATFTVNKYTLNLTWRELGRPPWLALVVAPPLDPRVPLQDPTTQPHAYVVALAAGCQLPWQNRKETVTLGMLQKLERWEHGRIY